MTIIKVDPPYKPLVQMPYCCAPCVFLWVLHRRGYWIDQEELVRYCKVRVPRKSAKAFMENINISKKIRGVNKDFGLNIAKLLKEKELPFVIETIFISKVKDPKNLITENLKKGNDIILCLHSKPFKRYTFNNGHCLVISAFDTEAEKLTLGDPSQINSKFWEVPLNNVINAMSKKYDGKERSFFVIKPN